MSDKGFVATESSLLLADPSNFGVQRSAPENLLSKASCSPCHDFVHRVLGKCSRTFALFRIHFLAKGESMRGIRTMGTESIIQIEVGDERHKVAIVICWRRSGARHMWIQPRGCSRLR